MSKKSTKATKEVSSYETRDIVLGKVRGYPPWPGMVVDPETAPRVVMKERPATKKTHFYCVRFFPTGDYAWLVSKDISKLQPHEIQSYINEPYKKSGDLLQGYRIAVDPTKWEEERDAARRLAAEEEANAEVDQLESENDGSAELDDDDVKGRKSKKRKRESEAGASSKAKKVSKKKDGGDTKKKPAGKVKRNGKKMSAMVESEEEDGDHVAADDADIGPSKKGSPPPQKRQKRGGDDDGDDARTSDPEAMKVRDWRHKLQKTFLSHKGLPKDEDMPSIDNLFTTVENYDKLTIEYLQFSKIGKVMRHIAALTDEKVPRNAEFKFKERADALVKKWQQILNANKPNGATAANAAGVGVETTVSAASLGPLSASLGPTPVPAPNPLVEGMRGEDSTVTQVMGLKDLNGNSDHGAPVESTLRPEPTMTADSTGVVHQAQVQQDVTMAAATLA